MIDNELSNALSSNYMSADLSLSIWQGTKTDRRASEELETSKAATHGTAKVVKTLLAGNETMKACTSAYGRIRTWFYRNTLSMGNGIYAIPTVNAMKFLGQFAKLHDEAVTARDELIAQYDDAVAEAQQRLGNLFNPADYPRKDQVEALFQAYLRCSPMHAVNDYDRLVLPARLLTGLKDIYAAQIEQQANAAVTDLQGRMLAELNRMVEQFGKVERGERTKLFKSLIDNMRGLVDLARGIGSLDNGLLSSTVSAIEEKLLAYEIGAYKDNPVMAREAREAAQSIIKQISTSAPTPATVVEGGEEIEVPDFDPEEVFY